MDLPFLELTVLLLTIGLVMLFSASYPSAYDQHEQELRTGGDGGA